MARRPIHMRAQYVADNVLRFVILAVITVLVLASVILFLKDPARGASAGAIVVLAGWIGWKMTDQASHRELSNPQNQ